MDWTAQIDIVFPLQRTGVGRVEEAITPTRAGQIRYQAIYWWAEWLEPRHRAIAHPGTRVEVVARRGNTLLVRPAVAQINPAYDAGPVEAA